MKLPEKSFISGERLRKDWTLLSKAVSGTGEQVTISGDGNPESGRTPEHTVGASTLELLRAHDGYSRLVWEKLNTLGTLEGRVLEVGCGIGTFSRRILENREVSVLHGVEIDSGYVQRLREEIQDPRFEIYCASAEDYVPPGPLYDHVFSVNVFEHIKDDARAMRTVERSLVPGGEFWILVPAHPCLYSELDVGLSHWRRYTRAALMALAREAGLLSERVLHFNPIGALGWWFIGKVLRRRVLPEREVAFYDRFGLSLSRLMDRLNPFPFGISLIAKLRKPLAK